MDKKKNAQNILLIGLTVQISAFSVYFFCYEAGIYGRDGLAFLSLIGVAISLYGIIKMICASTANSED